MAKLNQIIAIEKGIKSSTHSELSNLYKLVQKPELFNGLSKNYKKKDEEGEDLPPDNKRVQQTVQGALEKAKALQSDLMQVTARKDWTNCEAKADVVIDGKTLLEDVPVTYLLFLEKQLTDLRTFVEHLPTLDEAEAWNLDPNSGLFRTEPTQTHRTKKVAKPIVLYQATPEHPAQTQMIQEDIIAGFWIQVKQSGAMPVPEKQQLLGRIEELVRAVKQAREEANGCNELPAGDVAGKIFEYVLGR